MDVARRSCATAGPLERLEPDKSQGVVYRSTFASYVVHRDTIRAYFDQSTRA